MSLRAQTLEQFHVELSAKSPTPGGGAVAGVTGAMGAALAHMVVAYSFTKSLMTHEAMLRDAGQRLARARDLLLALADEDAEAYRELSEALKIPRDDPERAQRVPGAALGAIQVPLSIMATCCDVLRIATGLPGKTNPHLGSDLAIAVMLAETACRAGAENVKVNIPLLGTNDTAPALEAECEALLGTAGELRASIEAARR